MSNEAKRDQRPQKSRLAGIDADETPIQPCQQRLALSASLMGELLLDALEFDTQSAQPNQASPSPSPDYSASDGSEESPSFPDRGSQTADALDLLSQAADLRNTHGIDGSGQTVAVIDSGIAWNHVALGGGLGPGYRVVGGWDFAENDSDPYDDGPSGYHGTHVAGLLGGSTDDGFQGIAPGADMVALRVFDDYGSSQLEWIESALQWVHDNQDAFESPITTINLSVGAALNESNLAEANAMLADELQQLRDDQILVFAAAGNFFDIDNPDSNLVFPAMDDSVVAVSSTASDGTLSEFSQRQPGVFAAHGEGINSSVPDHVFGWDGNVNDFAELDGTSMATPQVAGASMLVRQAMINEGLNPTAEDVLDRMRELSRQNADPLSGNHYHIIDLTDAVSSNTINAQNPVNRFVGTSRTENAVLDLRDGIKLEVGDQTFSLSTDNESPIVIDAGDGADSLTIIGSENAERLIARPVSDLQGGSATAVSSELSTNEFSIQLRGFEDISFDGGGGRDRATLHDSSGDDKLTSHTDQTTLSGTGFRFDVLQIPRVYVHATGGGEDVAFLHDSAGDDTLSVRPQFSSLRGEETFQLAYGFEQVFAYATTGNDTAKIYDSAGDDVMSVSATRSIITGPDYQVSARGFSSVTGYSINGGNDLARIYGDPSANQWHSTSDMVQWTGQDDDVRVARSFERTMAFEDYQPIALQPLSFLPPLQSVQDSTVDDENATSELFDRSQFAKLEADASRSIFQQLGNQ